ncbi:MAG: T9SS type A sorting domain-containing protein [Flavobacteriales bacterium]|nr:T9SS type A sorting domain-containing protein [Flavobacteriales bacterium]
MREASRFTNLLAAWPNPSSDELFVESTEPGTKPWTEILLYDATGRQFDRRVARRSGRRLQVDIRGIASGTYIGRLSDTGQLFRFVKR